MRQNDEWSLKRLYCRPNDKDHCRQFVSLGHQELWESDLLAKNTAQGFHKSGSTWIDGSHLSKAICATKR